MLIYGIDPSQWISHTVKPEPLAKFDSLEHVSTKRPHWSKLTLHTPRGVQSPECGAAKR